MRLAIVHDWMNRPIGGGEQVLLELANLYPEAPIYTLMFDQTYYENRLELSRVRTSWLQRLPGWVNGRSRYLLPLIPHAVESFEFGNYDVVVSSSCAYVKNILTNPSTLHICYCHAPMRFVWDYWPQYLEEQKLDPVRSLAVRILTSKLRVWDYAGVQRVNVWLANSTTTKDRIKKFYGAEAQVIYPPVDITTLRTDLVHGHKVGDYYVTLATLTPYKKIDLAVRAFNATGRRLLVLGDGPERSRLERIAAANIELVGYVSAEQKAKYLSGAKGLIFPAEEDFGIAPIEAMVCGAPVIAFGKGGLTETVTEGKTGIFFAEQTVKAINQAVEKAEKTKFSADDFGLAVQRFSAEKFREKITVSIEKAYQQHVLAKPVY